MIPLSSPTETELTHDSIASLRVRASYSQLPTLRGITRTVANNTGLDVDGTADLALAMDEVASILIGHAIPSSDLTCRFDTVGRTLRTVVSVIAHFRDTRQVAQLRMVRSRSAGRFRPLGTVGNRRGRSHHPDDDA